MIQPGLEQVYSEELEREARAERLERVTNHQLEGGFNMLTKKNLKKRRSGKIHQSLIVFVSIIALTCLSVLAQSPALQCEPGERLIFFSAGEADNFDPDIDSPSANDNAVYENTVKNTNPNSSFTGFDSTQVNRIFFHVFESLPLNITKAAVETRLKAIGELFFNDNLQLRFTDASLLSAGTNFSQQLSPFGFNQAGVAKTMTVNLGQNYIDLLNQLGTLVVLVQDDTSVDYVSLTLCVRDADFSIAKEVLGGPYEVGEIASFTLTAKNEGPFALENGAIRIIEMLPEGLSFVAATGTDWSCSLISFNPDVVECIYTGPLPIAISQLPTVKIDGQVTSPGGLRNCALVQTGRLTATSTFFPVQDVNPSNDETCREFETSALGGQTPVICNSEEYLVVLVAGVKDNFDAPANGDEPPFDSDEANYFFNYTFSSLPGGINKAAIQTTITATHSLASNDTIGFGTGNTDLNLTQAGAVDKTFQLDALKLNSDGSLTVIIQDDTSVDFLALYLCISVGSSETEDSTGSDPVQATNLPPVAIDDFYVAESGRTLNVTATRGVLDNDTDPEGDALTAELVTDAANGALLLQSSGAFTYFPLGPFCGTETFEYRAVDSAGNKSNIAVVSIEVSCPPPTAVNDFYLTQFETQLTVNAPGVLENDIDPSQAGLTVILISGPGNGGLEIRPDGSFIYEPRARFCGTDEFKYKVIDANGRQSNTATVRIQVRCP